jgi:hypothetical protein
VSDSVRALNEDQEVKMARVSGCWNPECSPVDNLDNEINCYPGKCFGFVYTCKFHRPFSTLLHNISSCGTVDVRFVYPCFLILLIALGV